MLLWLMNMGFAGGGFVQPSSPLTPAAIEIVEGGRSVDYIAERNRAIQRDDEEILDLIKIFVRCL